ncbi:MAG: phosphoglycolate phosphatase-like HAD superfamily hydrolase [Planctomycetota bacterium]
MSDSLRALGVELLAGDSGGFELKGGDSDWLRAVLVSFGFRAHIEGTTLCVPETDVGRLERAVRAAIAPEAILFDLDGVLADIGSRRAIANVHDVQAVAARFPIAVVTTCPRRLAESALDAHGFLEFISIVVGSEERPCKPDPYPVNFALQQLGKQAAWMLGDNPSDVTAARGAGVVPFAVLPRGIGAESHMDRLRAAGAVRMVTGVESILPLLPPRAE